jgi:hypothetical protein
MVVDVREPGRNSENLRQFSYKKIDIVRIVAQQDKVGIGTMANDTLSTIRLKGKTSHQNECTLVITNQVLISECCSTKLLAHFDSFSR